jgi:deoxyribose-phosphate aldolase
MSDLAQYIDHTNLRPDASSEDIELLCQEAIEYHFKAVCVSSSRVAQASYLLEDHGIKVTSVVGFPLGSVDSDVKRYEAEMAIDLGADEIDMVLNVGKLKDGEDKLVFREIRDVVEAASSFPVKVILETCLLSEDEKIRATKLTVEAGANFVKTSTGFSTGGASVEDVVLLRAHAGAEFGVKASGGIKDATTARAMIEAGANRLGTSSGVAIVTASSDSNGEY